MKLKNIVNEDYSDVEKFVKDFVSRAQQSTQKWPANDMPPQASGDEQAKKDRQDQHKWNKGQDELELQKSTRYVEEDPDLMEISNQLLARYKTAAGQSARQADQAGNFEKGNKRFSGIVRATKKQFDNDKKASKVPEHVAEAGQDFTNILTKQHTKQQPERKSTVTIPYHGWDIRYRPAAKPGDSVKWIVIRKDQIQANGEASSDEDAVRDAQNWIKKSAGAGKEISKNATIDFNARFTSMFSPNGETFYTTFVQYNGEPSIVLSREPKPGLQKSALGRGGHRPAVQAAASVMRPVGLQPHGRYVIDVSRETELDDKGVFVYPLIFQGTAQDKNDRVRLNEPGFTVAVSRSNEMDEAIDPWHGYTADDPKANALAKAPKSTMQGKGSIRFSDMVCDTIETHGMKWAFDYYVRQHGLPPRMFKIFAAKALTPKT